VFKYQCQSIFAELAQSASEIGRQRYVVCDCTGIAASSPAAVANAPAPGPPGHLALNAVARKGRPGGSDGGNHRRRRVFPRERRLAEPVIASVAEKTDTEHINDFCG